MEYNANNTNVTINKPDRRLNLGKLGWANNNRNIKYNTNNSGGTNYNANTKYVIGKLGSSKNNTDADLNLDGLSRVNKNIDTKYHTSMLCEANKYLVMKYNLNTNNYIPDLYRINDIEKKTKICESNLF